MNRILDYGGTMVSMVAYLLITSGDRDMLLYGLALGTVGSVLLLALAIRVKLTGLKGLQAFFICANIYALVKLLGG